MSDQKIDWKALECGAVWQRTTQNGEEKLLIVIKIDGKEYRFDGMTNRFKNASNQPDFRIYKSPQGNKPAAAKTATTAPATATKKAAPPVKKPAPASIPELDVSDDLPDGEEEDPLV